MKITVIDEHAIFEAHGTCNLISTWKETEIFTTLQEMKVDISSFFYQTIVRMMSLVYQGFMEVFGHKCNQKRIITSGYQKGGVWILFWQTDSTEFTNYKASNVIETKHGMHEAKDATWVIYAQDYA